MEVYIGTVMPFPYNFVPKDWMACNGQVLPIQGFTPLFALIGAAYGGDGRTNFALPNLNNTGTGQASRAVAGQGTGTGLSPRVLGQKVGESTHVLTGNEMAAHNHPLTVYSGASGKVAAPSAGATLIDPTFHGFANPGTTPATTLLPQTVVAAGGGGGHPNEQPYLQLYYCICYNGIYPVFIS